MVRQVFVSLSAAVRPSLLFARASAPSRRAADRRLFSEAVASSIKVTNRFRKHMHPNNNLNHRP
jgi:hypothetical protein